MYILLGIVVVAAIAYFLFINFNFQIFLHQKKISSAFLKEFTKKVNGTYYKKAYFAKEHKIVSPKEYNSFNSRHKSSFSHCYNCITFSTQETHWELFFTLIKDNSVFSEIMYLRAFPKKVKLRSQANVERTFSRISVLANNKYLNDILDSSQVQEYISWLLQKDGEVLIVSQNALYFKSLVESRKMSVDKTMNSVKAMNAIKDRVYRKGILEY